MFRHSYKTNHSVHKVSLFKKFLRWVFRLFMFGMVVGLLATGTFFLWAASLEIPNRSIDEIIAAQSTKIYDASGEVLLYDVYGEERRTSISLDEISKNMQLAILATEDDQFYSHSGYDISGIMRGVCYQFSALVGMHSFGGRCNAGGGSTISQQVIKNTLLSTERTVERKVKELVLARKLEQQKSKQEILEIYLNEIAFGGTIYGVEQASLSYFDKHAASLSVAESAYLAALPKAPTTYLRNRAKFDGRQQYILGRMLKLGYITAEQYKEAKAEEITFVHKEHKGIQAPHFVFHVLEELESVGDNIESLGQNGYRVTTTLNWGLQSNLEEIAASHTQRLSEDFGASNLAILALENKTGKIRAMVGSKDYFAADIDGKFNITTAYRQPGSTFKPIVYALAFIKGYLPETLLWDTPTEFSQACLPNGEARANSEAEDCYMPQNYDRQFRGPIDLRHALAQSLNVPAVKLLYLVGVSNAMQLARDLGITSLNKAPSFYGLNLVLGGGEVRMIDMARAYSVFANGGEQHTLAAWDKVVDRNGVLLHTHQEEKRQVIEPQIAAMINQVLSDNNAKRPLYGQNSRLYYEDGQSVAVKTGTTNNFRDVWTIGYSSDVTLAVWAGNNDNTPMASKPSSSIVGPLWREAMDATLEHYQAPAFEPYTLDEEVELPPMIVGDYHPGQTVYIDKESGEVIDEPSESGVENGEYDEILNSEYHSILHYIDVKNPQAFSPEGSQSNGLYEHFEHGVLEWVSEQEWTEEDASIFSEIDSGEHTSTQNEQEDTRPTRVNFDFSIRVPKEGLLFERGRSNTVQLVIQGSERQIETVYYYINNSYVGSGGSHATSWDIRPDSVRGVGQENTLRVIVETVDGLKITKSVPLRVQ